MTRVLKKDGILIFTIHERTILGKRFFFWIWQAFKIYILKNIGFNTEEIDFGDRFFKREVSSDEKGNTYSTKQYIHIPSINEVKNQINQIDNLKILEINKSLQKDNKKPKKRNPVFFVVQKIKRKA